MKYYAFILIICFQSFAFAQENIEKPPIFDLCKEEAFANLQKCFDTKVFNLLFENYKVPEKMTVSNYKGEIVILFKVDKDGAFRTIYIDAVYPELKAEATRVINQFPKIDPATYNGKPTYKQYSIALKIPLEDQTVSPQDLAIKAKEEHQLNVLEKAAKTELEKVNLAYKPYSNKEYTSQLNIPFSHENYSRFDRATNLIGTNSHTASKPFVYEDVSAYYDFEGENEALKKETQTWSGKKLWNEHLV
ncbi:hypothetical protein [Lacinutrix sp.]|uniref:hypothetical protein n=1 Tax=Lacinutrix sp. TaxID=1937692 RepID=UPI0030EE4095